MDGDPLTKEISYSAQILEYAGVPELLEGQLGGQLAPFFSTLDDLLTPTVLAEIQRICRVKSLRILGRHMPGVDHQDVSQSVLLKLCASFPDLKARTLSEVYSWVHRVAHNTCIDLIRSLGITKHGQDHLSQAMQRSAIELSIEDIYQIKEAMERLSKIQREVLRLRFVEGLSVAETAEVMGISANNVKYQTRKALRNIREYNRAQDQKQKSEQICLYALEKHCVDSCIDRCSGENFPSYLARQYKRHLSICSVCSGEVWEISRIVTALKMYPGDFFPGYDSVWEWRN